MKRQRNCDLHDASRRFYPPFTGGYRLAAHKSGAIQLGIRFNVLIEDKRYQHDLHSWCK